MNYLVNDCIDSQPEGSAIKVVKDSQVITENLNKYQAIIGKNGLIIKDVLTLFLDEARTLIDDVVIMTCPSSCDTAIAIYRSVMLFDMPDIELGQYDVYYLTTLANGFNTTDALAFDEESQLLSFNVDGVKTEFKIDINREWVSADEESQGKRGSS